MSDASRSSAPIWNREERATAAAAAVMAKADQRERSTTPARGPGCAFRCRRIILRRVTKRRGLSALYGSLPATVSFPGKEAVREHVGRELGARHLRQRSPDGSTRWDLDGLAESAAEDLELASQGLQEWATELEEEDRR